jgi:hypothetical protein
MSNFLTQNCIKKNKSCLCAGRTFAVFLSGAAVRSYYTPETCGSHHPDGIMFRSGGTTRNFHFLFWQHFAAFCPLLSSPDLWTAYLPDFCENYPLEFSSLQA